jgi:uncharacterized protein YecE (DUF72 family)
VEKEKKEKEKKIDIYQATGHGPLQPRSMARMNPAPCVMDGRCAVLLRDQVCRVDASAVSLTTTSCRVALSAPSMECKSPVLLKCGLMGWTDEGLVKCGRFYPSLCKNGAERLKHYASKFPVVEVDTSHYAIPSLRIVGDWAKAVKQYRGFQFHVKAFGMFTLKAMACGQLPYEIRQQLESSGDGFLNRSRLISWDTLGETLQHNLWSVFNERLSLLHRRNLLGIVLFQFQLDFTPSPVNREWVLYCRSRLPEGIKMGVEFRCRDWYNVSPPVTVWFKQIKHCVQIISDELVHELHRNKNRPTLAGTIPILASTHVGVSDDQIVYVRVHRREGKERILDQDWMTMWKKRIDEELNGGQEIHVLFGTAWEDQAVKNAQLLYKACGVDVGKVWRLHHRKSSALGKFFKAGRMKDVEIPTKSTVSCPDVQSDQTGTSTAPTTSLLQKRNIRPPDVTLNLKKNGKKAKLGNSSKHVHSPNTNKLGGNNQRSLTAFFVRKN